MSNKRIKFEKCPGCCSNEEVRVLKHEYYGVHCICGRTYYDGSKTSDEAIKGWNKRKINDSIN